MGPRPLVLTQGDPAGVGPELLLKAAAEGRLRPGDLVVAGRAFLDALAAGIADDWATRGRAAIEAQLLADFPAEGGQVEALRRGVDLVLAAEGRAQHRALVTAPIDKAVARAEGLHTPGHTEYLAERAGTEDFAMAMIGARLRLTLATIHLPLAEVPRRLDRAAIVRAGRLLADALRHDFGIERARVAVCGLNPHAGEGGLLGREDDEIIAPAIAELARLRPEVEFAGPLPADAAMALVAQRRFDGVVAMYHDQGLAPFKFVHFHDGVNMTLGLPFVRTSPDHGTAKDIAGSGRVDPTSFFEAIRLARGEAPTAA